MSSREAKKYLIFYKAVSVVIPYTLLLGVFYCLAVYSGFHHNYFAAVPWTMLALLTIRSLVKKL